MVNLGTVDTINVILGEPFKLSEQDPDLLNKIRDEVFDKINACETQLSPIYQELNEGANSWRMIPKRTISKRPYGIFNSKSGESNRAANTLASLWFRMCTASDPYFEAVKEGLDQNGMELTDDDLYAAETVLTKQLRASEYKRKLLKTLRSLAMFGTVFVEEPFITRPDIEFTDFNLRSLLLTFFDPFVFDASMSDYVAFIDFPTNYKMRDLYKNDRNTWDGDLVEKSIKDFEDSLNLPTFDSRPYSNVMQRKQRAGYSTTGVKTNQLSTYHGKINTDNDLIQKIWAMGNYQGDPDQSDWTISILGNQIVRLHPTPYGTWRHHVKIGTFNEFELEPIGYGVGKIGKKSQRELDVTQSRMNDLLMFSLYSMWKVGKYSGMKANQFTIKPWNIIELEDITQLDQIKIDPNIINQALAMQNVLKEDFRTTSGATTNLQAAQTGATATEAGLAQTEAMRGASVNAEIISESLVRSHVETSYINNLDMLDREIFVSITGRQAPYTTSFNRHNLPRGVGFQVKTTTDKDFRPERQKNILQGLQLATSIRNMIPESINVIRPLFVEWFRSMGLNPRLLDQQVPLKDKIMQFVQRQQAMGGGQLANQLGAETGDEQSGFPNVSHTPIGPIPTSPVSPIQQAA